MGRQGIVAGAGFIAVGAMTYTTDGSFPVGNHSSPCPGGFYQGTHGGVEDLAILTFDLNGVPVWRTFYGGSGHEESPVGVAVYSTYLYVVGNTNGSLPASHLPNPGGGAYHDDTYNGGATMQFFCVLIMPIVRFCGGRRVRMRGLVMGVGGGRRGGMEGRYGWRG
jgi:hypothetical protein